MRQHTDLFPTDSLAPFLQVELIHPLLKGRFILWVDPIEKLFHVMSNAIGLDNQTFLSELVDSFINFFHLFLYFPFISQMKAPAAPGGCWGLEVTVFWKGQQPVPWFSTFV